MGCRFNSKVALVVDDEAFARLLAVQVFLDRGFTVLEAADAAEALDVLDCNDDVSLLFTDISMPGELDGVDLIERVRDSRPEIAILVTSGHAQPLTDRIPRDAPFLPKPYPVHCLDEAIKSASGTQA